RLKVLNLRGNRITNLQPLVGLAHLQKLGLDGNQVSDLSPLLGLRQLKVLDLYGNPHLRPGQVTRLRLALPGCRVLVGDP
ncbi:MAG: leucine-rich repeat domain-containing protein, partial [Verrucomicrobiota bacterium]|nr:leucine-rich repeat domain-containing protein [Verrucomicrobiota bacterium]